MEKQTLTRFITKYNVSGIDRVCWDADGDSLSVKIATDNHNLFGTVRGNDLAMPEGTYGIIDTRTLNSLLGVLDDDVQIKIKKNAKKTPTAMSFSDDVNTITFMLADIQVIPPAFKGVTIPSMEATFKVDSDFITTFIKAKNALPNAETFTVFCDDTGAKIVVGHHPKQNSHTVDIPISTPMGLLSKPLVFPADNMKEVLVANKESEGATLQFSDQGLLYIVFDVDGFELEYFMLAMQHD